MAGLAGGVWNTAFQIGGALGLAGVTALSTSHPDLLTGFHRALLLPVAATAGALVVLATGPRGRA
jgi:hypothetical protein